MPPRPLSVRLLIPLLILAGVPAYAQERPRLVIASESRDSILQALRIECDSLQLVFVSQNNKRALYQLDAGMMSVRQQMAPVTLEITFHLEDGKPGTRIVVSEELVGPGPDLGSPLDASEGAGGPHHRAHPMTATSTE